MRRNVELIRVLLRMLYDALMIMLVVFFVESTLIKERMEYLIIPAVLFMCSVSYIVRCRLSGYGTVLLLHLPLAAAVMLIPVSAELRGVLLAVAFALVMESFSHLGRGHVLRPLNDFPWPSFLCAVVVYLYGIYIHDGRIIFMSYIITVLMLVIYYVMVYIEGLRNYIDSSKDVSGLPLNNMVASGTVIVTAIVVILIIGIITGRFFRMDRIFIRLGNGLAVLFRLVAYGFVLVITVIGNLFSSGSYEAETLVAEAENEVSGQISVVGDALEVLLEIGLFLLALWLVYRVMSSIVRKLMMRSNPASDIVEAVGDVDGYAKDKAEIRKHIGGWLSRKARARRCYRTAILKYRYDIKLDEYRTAVEIQDDIEQNDIGDVSEITALYSEIRYGKKEADRAVLSAMNRLSKQ